MIQRLYKNKFFYRGMFSLTEVRPYLLIEWARLHLPDIRLSVLKVYSLLLGDQAVNRCSTVPASRAAYKFLYVLK